MKYYMLFAGKEYYPYGGMKDWADCYDSVEEAKEVAKEIIYNFHELPVAFKYDWWQIVDADTWEILEEGYNTWK